MQHHQRISRQPNADQRLLKAGAEAAHAGQHHIEAAALDGLVQGVKDLFRAIAAAAGSHAHRDARNRRHQLGKPGFANRVEGANILNSRHYFLPCLGLAQRFHFPLQRALIHMAENVVVHLDHRGQRALAKAGHGADREAAVGGGERQLVGLVAVARLLFAEPQIEADLLQQIARAARMAGRSAADADHVVALRVEVEERIECGGAVDGGRRNAGLLGDVAQRLHGEILVRVGGLHRLQDSQQRSGAAAVLCNRLVDQQPLVSIQHFISDTLHDSSASCPDLPPARQNAKLF